MLDGEPGLWKSVSVSKYGVGILCVAKENRQIRGRKESVWCARCFGNSSRKSVGKVGSRNRFIEK